jgi:hypothetical protein
VRTKGELHRPKSEIGTTAFIGDRESVSSDTELATFHLSETDAAGAKNDNASIAPTMCTQASNFRVRGVDNFAKRMWESQKRFAGASPINSGQSHASARLCKGSR